MSRFVKFFSALCIIFYEFVFSASFVFCNDIMILSNQTGTSLAYKMSEQDSIVNIFKLIIIILVILIISLLMGFVFKYFYTITENNKKSFKIKRR